MLGLRQNLGYPTACFSPHGSSSIKDYMQNAVGQPVVDPSGTDAVCPTVFRLAKKAAFCFVKGLTGVQVNYVNSISLFT